ncbi:hypothetical protein TL16_g08960 [Triparma laevis f. inornata]|uniref:Uncharacterized protein n=1 Tax=Triparma laevis f. inornata TaxID=1714386 RepID=A0A9W7B5M1_9STRA|nr:hypothetical protein TL16_g08960 [Triparma laevis f. inornata]
MSTPSSTPAQPTSSTPTTPDLFSSFFTYPTKPSYGPSTTLTLHTSVETNADGSTIIFAAASDGEFLFKGQKRVENPLSDDKQLTRNTLVKTCLLDPTNPSSLNDSVKLHLAVENQNTDSSRINLKIKQTLTVSHDTVDKVLLQFPLSVQETSPEGRLSFMKEAAETFGKEMKKCKSLEEENANLRKVIVEWQSTTTKLSSQLQTREDELLNNFVVLLNSKKQEINKLKASLSSKKASNPEKDGAQDKGAGVGVSAKKKEKVRVQIVSYHKH